MPILLKEGDIDPIRIFIQGPVRSFYKSETEVLFITNPEDNALILSLNGESGFLELIPDLFGLVNDSNRDIIPMDPDAPLEVRVT